MANCCENPYIFWERVVNASRRKYKSPYLVILVILVVLVLPVILLLVILLL